MSSTKQGAKVSRKTSNSKSILDWKIIIGSLGGMSAVGLELEKFINPKLTWKAVAKRCRSSSRRARRHIPRSFVVGEKLSLQVSREAKDGTASDTEKHGVAILGRRFSDKIEDIPLKKRRRFMLRSPSPPSRSHQEPSQPVSYREKLSKAVDDSAKVGHQQKSQDFSGLEILAAVASSNVTSQVDHDHSWSTKIRIGSRSAPKDEVRDGKDKGSSLLDEAGAVSPIKKEIGSEEGPGSVRDTRLHWDLNVPADAWENPSDSSAIGGNLDASTCLLTGTEERIEVLKNSEVNSECKKTQSSEDAKDAVSVSADTEVSFPAIHEAGNTRDGFDSSAELYKNGESHGCLVSDANDSRKIASPISSLDHLDCVTISGNDGIGCSKIKEGVEVLSSDGAPANAKALGLKNHDATSPSSANMITGDRSDDSYDSDVYQTEKAGVNESGTNEELLDGYDSQFEDGELREPDARHYWDEHEGEDGEVEQVNCGDGLKQVEAEGNGDRDTAKDNPVGTKTNEKGLPSVFVGTRWVKSAPERKNSYSGRNLFPRDGTNFRSKRDRHLVNTNGRSPGRSTSYWKPAHTYHGRPRPKAMAERRSHMISSDRMNSQEERFAEFEHRTCTSRQYVNTRRRSPSNRGDDSYGTDPMPLMRNQFRRSTNPRSIREEEEFRNSFPGAAATAHQYSVQNRKRDRSMSPVPRGRYEDRLQSRSRSRLHDEGSYMRSRSPGMNRGAARMPVQKPYEGRDRQFTPNQARPFDFKGRNNQRFDSIRSTQGNNRRFDSMHDESRPVMQQHREIGTTTGSANRRRFELSRNEAADES
ncbi:hypothetical protein LINPERHAP2_LOCUS34896 [Linum perenne]